MDAKNSRTDLKPKRKPKHQLGSNYSPSEILYLLLSRWYWFVISALITTGCAVYKVLTTQPTYTRYAVVHIESGKRNNLYEQMENFANMGTGKASTNAYNEIYTFKAPETIKETARRLKLYTEYYSQGTFHNNTLYGESLPATVSLCDLDIQEQASLTMDIAPDGKFRLYNFKGKDVQESKAVEGNFDNDSITLVLTPLGDIILERNRNFHFGQAMTVHINQIGIDAACGKLSGRLAFSTGNSDEKSEASELINISVNDHSIERADDILTTLVQVYNENWVNDKNKAALGTAAFIEKRLEKISGELNKMESDISAFKSDNQLPDLNKTIASNMSKEKDAIRSRNALDNELEMAEYILKSIKDKAKENNLLPLNSGINNININSQIQAYNNLMIERNNLVSKSSVDNPSVKEADITLSSMRNSIISTTDTHIRHLKAQRAALEKEIGHIQKEIAKSPEQTTFLTSAERELSVKEKIYMFLLQKQAENQLSQAFTAYNTRIITPPTGSIEPTAPESKRTIGLGLLIGLAIPLVIVIIIEVTNTKARGRKDLEGLTAPIIGEIPQIGNTSRFNFKKRNEKKRNKGREKLTIAVEEGSRNIINEAFRVLRTNIEFMTREKSNNVIIYTSFNPGSGKTFCILNTAISLAIKNERVLVIDGDMRHASLSNYVDSPDKGLSNYLAKETDSQEEITVIDEKYHNLHVIPVGTIPPNPTELLKSDRFAELLEEAKKKYTYILIDRPLSKLWPTPKLSRSLRQIHSSLRAQGSWSAPCSMSLRTFTKRTSSRASLS